MERKNFSYDPMTDGLIVSRREEGEKVMCSDVIADLILDFTPEGRVVGVEYIGLSEYLEFIGIDLDLNELIGAELIVREHNDSVSLFFLLKTTQVEKMVPLATVSISKPIPAI